ncbi:hypothetical protein IQ03_02859 [Gemmobacter caeni]|uniref:EthD domain-containing protein n=2 Tax=Gemmobacter TaxID=204456 RepID=A0A2T6AUQ2_9RHOB|nr:MULTISPECIES: hypothetical protein [Gemmobacter]OJY34455.1 MAG: hypothetical protein BGP11_17625 [Rhodobacterales bacterium 65-51]PTX47550.1 hypothetical protein C8N34_11238 [Gemmobacter caeni]TWI97741.1 hypothetical protein IQ03_02859 [Gemmobacter caeni]GHC29011.1 hypothetical protein GCM10007291_31800 [Gemmobacter nanjingensis]
MSFALVMFWQGGAALTEAGRGRLRALLGGLAGVDRSILYTPARASDLYTDDGAGPTLGVQIEAPSLEALEAACAADGALQALADPDFLPELAGAQADQQMFVLRRYPVDEAQMQTPAGEMPCSYVVHYPGPAQDYNAWMTHYIAGHPPIMRRFPGIRGIEILTRCDWISALPFARAGHMQRNRVLFDSPAALTAALHSPVRHEMRADFHTFPPFEGGNYHFPMSTEVV